jgi:hypothetical protein
MLETYPQPINLDRTKLAAAIDALIACGEACTACADACLSEDMVAQLTKCIRTNLDCADICATTARVLSRHTGYDANLSRTPGSLRHGVQVLRRRVRLPRRHAPALPHLRRRLPGRRAVLPRPDHIDELRSDHGRARRGDGAEDRGLPLRQVQREGPRQAGREDPEMPQRAHRVRKPYQGTRQQGMTATDEPSWSRCHEPVQQAVGQMRSEPPLRMPSLTAIRLAAT